MRTRLRFANCCINIQLPTLRTYIERPLLRSALCAIKRTKNTLLPPTFIKKSPNFFGRIISILVLSYLERSCMHASSGNVREEISSCSMLYELFLFLSILVTRLAFPYFFSLSLKSSSQRSAWLLLNLLE